MKSIYIRVDNEIGGTVMSGWMPASPAAEVIEALAHVMLRTGNVPDAVVALKLQNLRMGTFFGKKGVRSDVRH